MDKPSELTDEQLLLSLKEGNESALRLIYRKYWKVLYNECCRRLNDAQQSEELVQDIFADLWEKKADREIVNLKAYLITAVKYAVYRQYRRKKTLPSFEEPLEHLIYEDDSADSALFLKELHLYVERWLAAQPEKRREIFVRRYMNEHSTEQISQEMGVPQKTVQNTLRYTEVALKTDLGNFLILLPFFLDKFQ
ncbi:RNA polymerase sigma factor [Pedobacter hartonius]|uniref:RNA polymerase sigma-70 factor, ECF subfamily n=1 Tax=Pedobacter hartonius TaxID=425514 RepID=A0A1H4CU79_9SPHI|nr:sigma-70 family RNA polymerase sigma factor [Pedobacter hartonius]SEA63916.1 RNA polymerase sigma-70 factor, ECF subfamily [Pedobacter hartonius]